MRGGLRGVGKVAVRSLRVDAGSESAAMAPALVFLSATTPRLPPSLPPLDPLTSHLLTFAAQYSPRNTLPRFTTTSLLLPLPSLPLSTRGGPPLSYANTPGGLSHTPHLNRRGAPNRFPNKWLGPTPPPSLPLWDLPHITLPTLRPPSPLAPSPPPSKTRLGSRGSPMEKMSGPWRAH